MKKYLKILSAAISLTCVSAFSQPPAGPTPVKVANFSDLETYIGSLFSAGMSYFNAFEYQKMPELDKIKQTNTATTTPTATHYDTTSHLFGEVSNTQATQIPITSTGKAVPQGQGGQQPQPITPMQAAYAEAAYATKANLTDSLKQITYELNKRDKHFLETMNASNGLPYDTYIKENSQQNLTVGTLGTIKQCMDVNQNNPSQKPLPFCPMLTSDTLFSTSMDKVTSANKPYAEEPRSTDNDDYFNFGTLITPEAYTPKEEASAYAFIKYAAQSTQDFATLFKSDPNFQKLFRNPNAVAALKTNPAYINFMMSVRSLLAIRSVSLNMLYGLIAERTPMQGLGAAAGIMPQQGQNPSQVAASPLQVEAYQANHRLNSTDWYNQVENASPATVQRNTLIILAEIEHQNYEAHLDRERILAALTAMNLQLSQSNLGAFMVQEHQAISQALQSAVGGGNASGSSTEGGFQYRGSSSTNSTDNTATTDNTSTTSSTDMGGL